MKEGAGDATVAPRQSGTAVEEEEEAWEGEGRGAQR